MVLSLAKMHGAGNDFVVLPVAPPGPDEAANAVLVRALADRRRGVGGDGVLFLERSAPGSPSTLRMHFYNRDGSRAGLCLNGSRCVALRAVQLGWADRSVRITTDHQELGAEVELDPNGRAARVTLELDPPRAQAREVELPGPEAAAIGAWRATVVHTGDPHLVVEVDAATAARADFAALARPLRHWKGSGDAGANVHFVHRGSSPWVIRSFERGVEDETLACGSGCVSAVCTFGDLATASTYDLLTRSGAVLSITPGPRRWTLRGPAVCSFETQWRDDA